MRREGWPERLAAVLGRPDPFVWGVNDCCLFAADAVVALTGVDPAADYRGRYRTAGGALRRVGAGGVAGLAERIAARHGWPAADPRMARRGDVAFIPFANPFGGLLGVVAGARVAMWTEQGLTAVPLRLAARAWRIG